MGDLRKFSAYLGFLLYLADMVIDLLIFWILLISIHDEAVFAYLIISFIILSSIVSNIFARRVLWDDDEGYEFLKCGKKGILCMSIFQVLPTYSHVRNLYLIWRGFEDEVVWVNKNLKLLHGLLHSLPQLCVQSIAMSHAMTETPHRAPHTMQWVSLFLSVWMFSHVFISYAFNNRAAMEKVVLFFGCWIAAVCRLTICGIMSSYKMGLWFVPSLTALAVVIIIYHVCRYYSNAHLTQHFFTNLKEQDITAFGLIQWTLTAIFDTFSWTGMCVSAVYLLTTGVSLYMDDRRSTVAFYIACFLTVLNAVSVATRKYRLLWAGNTDLY